MIYKFIEFLGIANIGALIIMLCSVLFIFLIPFRRLLGRWAYGPFLCETLFCGLCGYVSARLPIYHYRMQTALKTTEGIIRSSETYRNNYISAAGSADKIPQYLYYAGPGERKALLAAGPQDLYSHCFGMLDRIRLFCGRIRLDEGMKPWAVLLFLLLLFLLAGMACSAYECISAVIKVGLGALVCFLTSNGALLAFTYMGLLSFAYSVITSRTEKEKSSILYGRDGSKPRI